MLLGLVKVNAIFIYFFSESNNVKSVKSFGCYDIFEYLCSMKNSNNPSIQPEPSSLVTEIFRKKAVNYLVCFNEQCECKEHCLRWLTGCQIEQHLESVISVNPRNPKHGGESCTLFRPDNRVAMKMGLTVFYENMTGRQETLIRKHLIRIYNRRVYYEMRNGIRLITPADQQRIAAVCRQHGFNGPFIYDGEREEWDW